MAGMRERIHELGGRLDFPLFEAGQFCFSAYTAAEQSQRNAADRDIARAFEDARGLRRDDVVSVRLKFKKRRFQMIADSGPAVTR